MKIRERERKIGGKREEKKVRIIADVAPTRQAATRLGRSEDRAANEGLLGRGNQGIDREEEIEGNNEKGKGRSAGRGKKCESMGKDGKERRGEERRGEEFGGFGREKIVRRTRLEGRCSGLLTIQAAERSNLFYFVATRIEALVGEKSISVRWLSVK